MGGSEVGADQGRNWVGSRSSGGEDGWSSGGRGGMMYVGPRKLFSLIVYCITIRMFQ